MGNGFPLVDKAHLKGSERPCVTSLSVEDVLAFPAFCTTFSFLHSFALGVYTTVSFNRVLYILRSLSCSLSLSLSLTLSPDELAYAWTILSCSHDASELISVSRTSSPVHGCYRDLDVCVCVCVCVCPLCRLPLPAPPCVPDVALVVVLPSSPAVRADSQCGATLLHLRQ